MRDLLRRGGLLFLRLNSVSTQIRHAHTVIERNDFGGVTVGYQAGPKQGLPVPRRLCGRHVLDVGCGEGHNTRLLARAGARMTRVDISERIIALAVEAVPTVDLICRRIR